MLFLYLVGTVLIYRNTRNLLSFQLLFAFVSLPPAIASSNLVGWLMAIGIFFIGIGGWLYNLLLRFKTRQRLEAFRAEPLNLGVYPKRAFIVMLVVITCLAVGGSIFYFYKVGISLFAEEVGYSRLVNRHAVSGSFVYQRLFRVFLPIICIVYFLMGRCKDTKRYYNTTLFSALVLVTGALLIFTGMRGNVVIFLFYPMMAVYGLYSNTANFSKILILTVTTFCFGFYVTVLMYPVLSSSELLLLIMARVSSSATDGLSYMAHVDVVQNGYYYGETYFNDVMSLFYKLGLTDKVYTNYGAFLAQSMLGDRYNGEQAAIYFMGELFANFGYIGLAIGSTFLGMFLQKLYINMLVGSKDVLFLACKIYFCAMFLAILGGPSISMFIDYAVSVSAFLVIFLMGVMFFAQRKDRVIINKRIYRLR